MLPSFLQLKTDWLNKGQNPSSGTNVTEMPKKHLSPVYSYLHFQDKYVQYSPYQKIIINNSALQIFVFLKAMRSALE